MTLFLIRFDKFCSQYQFSARENWSCKSIQFCKVAMPLDYNLGFISVKFLAHTSIKPLTTSTKIQFRVYLLCGKKCGSNVTIRSNFRHPQSAKSHAYLVTSDTHFPIAKELNITILIMLQHYIVFAL